MFNIAWKSVDHHKIQKQIALIYLQSATLQSNSTVMSSNLSSIFSGGTCIETPGIIKSAYRGSEFHYNNLGSSFNNSKADLLTCKDSDEVFSDSSPVAKFCGEIAFTFEAFWLIWAMKTTNFEEAKQSWAPENIENEPNCSSPKSACTPNTRGEQTHEHMRTGGNSMRA